VCENYLINKLHELYENSFENDSNNDGTPNQTGGNGVHKEDFTQDFTYYFYIVYK